MNKAYVRTDGSERQYNRAVKFFKNIFSVNDSDPRSWPGGTEKSIIVAYNTFGDSKVGHNREYRESLYRGADDMTAQCFGTMNARPDTTARWMFHVNAEYQIDFNRIVEDLTAEKPIALIRTPKTTYGLVRGSLVGKMVHAEHFEELRTRLVDCTEREGVLPKAVVYIVKQENLGNFFKLWRDVKAARHAKEHRNGKTEVVVTLQSL